MLSITSAAKQFNLPRDTILDAVRDGRLEAARDRRGVLRIEVSALIRFCGIAPSRSEKPEFGTVIQLRGMKEDRLARVIEQQGRLLREIGLSAAPVLAIEARI